MSGCRPHECWACRIRIGCDAPTDAPKSVLLPISLARATLRLHAAQTLLCRAHILSQRATSSWAIGDASLKVNATAHRL